MRFLLNNKIWTLLGNTANFSYAYGERKLLFQPFEVDRLNLKLAAVLARPKQRSDVTGCITLMPRWKFRVFMGEETNVQCPQKTSLGHLRGVKQLPTVAFDLKRRRVDPEAFQSIVYLHDILCKQANECKLLNRKTIGTLGQMSSTHLSNSYTHKVK